MPLEVSNHKNHIAPPKLARHFLLWFLRSDLAEEVLGDLDEKFYTTLKNKSKTKARRNYWYQVINYLRPFAFKLFKSPQSFGANKTTMIKHNLLVSYRNITKNKVHSFISIAGLSLGMIVTILMGLWVADELSFNKYHKNHDRIVQVLHQRARSNGEIMTNSSQVSQLGPHLMEAFPHFFEKVVLMPFRSEEVLLSKENISFYETGRYMQADALEMLGIEMIYGSYDGLTDAKSIMLSESLSKKLFNLKNPIGELVKLKTRTDLKVTGVYKDIPKNSEFSNSQFILPFTLSYGNDPAFFKWDDYNTAVYGQLKPNIDVEQVSLAIREVMFPYMESKPTAFVVPMKDWHLNNYYENGIKKTSPRLRFVWLNAIIGAFVLSLACINFMNLSTARSQKRMKEIGLRKAIGSVRGQLIKYFLLESFLYTFFAFLISLISATALLPWFNQIAEKSLTIPLESMVFWLASISFILLTSLLAGGYPALHLSSLNPIKALSGSQKSFRSKGWARQGLVIFQFTISIFLIISTIAIHNQTQHAKNRPIGYSQNGLIMMKRQNQEYAGKYETLRAELKNTGMVSEVTQSATSLISTVGQTGGFDWTGTEEEREVIFNYVFVRPEFGKTVGWKMLEGRDFDKTLSSDLNNGVIISESAALLIGLDDPIGHKIRAKNGFNGKKEFTIIGVATDMVKDSPFKAPVPAIIFPYDGDLRWLIIRIDPAVSLSKAIPVIKETWNNLAPTHPFNYQFVDDLYANKFREEEKISSLATFFSTIAILISALGLYGLAAFVAEQRTKEVGIRKILGASLASIWQLLSKDFVILIVISSIISIPVAYSILSKWLASYEYSIALEWWIFAAACIGTLCIALLIVSSQTIKAAAINPSKSLKVE